MMNSFKSNIRKMRWIIQVFLSLSLCFILTGCIQKTVIDEIGIIHTLGIDEEKGMLKATAIYPNYADNNKAVIVTAFGENPSSLNTNLNHKSQNHIVLGQIRTFIFGDTYSRAGISKVLETICKDPGIGNVSFVVSELESGEVMKPLLKGSPLYMSNLIEKSFIHEGLPETNLHSLVSQYYGSGIDVYLPNINLDPDGQVQVSGLAIFKGDKVKLKISNKEGFIFKSINDRNKRGYYDLTLPSNKKNEQKPSKEKQKTNLDLNQKIENNFAFESLYGDHQIRIKKKGKEKTAFVNLTLHIELKGIPDQINLKKKEELKYFEKTMEKLVKKDIEELLVKFQKNEVDPLGLGIIDRSQSKTWNEKDFYKNTYPKMKFSVKTNLILRQTGVGE